MKKTMMVVILALAALLLAGVASVKAHSPNTPSAQGEEKLDGVLGAFPTYISFEA